MEVDLELRGKVESSLRHARALTISASPLLGKAKDETKPL